MIESVLTGVCFMAFPIIVHFLRIHRLFKWFHIAVFGAYCIYFGFHIFFPTPGDFAWYDLYFCFVTVFHVMVLLLFKFFEWLYKSLDK